MSKLNRDALEKIAGNFRALSEPTRLAILQELKINGSMSVNEMVAALECSQANVSKQLRILLDAGFLCREQRATQAIYSICDEQVMQLCEIVCERLNRQAEASVAMYSI